MVDAALTALTLLADPFRFLMLMVGVLAGTVIGMLPGLGGVAAVSILLPFIYALDPYSGLAMLLGALGVVYTADTITSVLVGTPGSPASAPTAIEGFAMAKRGEAGRALGAAFLASMIGGLVGTFVLTLAIPVAGPLVLALGTPELLMLAILGLVYASGLIGTSPAKGLASGALGLLLGTIGVAPAAAELRYTFGQAYLLEGLSLVVVALGFFGIAEVMGMLGRGGAISESRFKLSGWAIGARDVLVNWTVAIKGALIGVVAGLIPAVGANASTWIAYGHAVSTAKDKSRVGKGEPRGIVASEGANNATVTADLVPTMLFGVPGGPAAAIFLGALFVYGYYPGPRFIQMNQDLMFLIIWTCALAAVIGAALCFLLSPFIARLTKVQFGLIAAPLLIVMLLGAYDSTKTYLDFVVLVMFGIVGWAMKEADWPRAPLLVGFVLSDPLERNFWLANQIHGWSWLGRPVVIGLLLVLALPVVWKLVKALRTRLAAQSEAGPTAADRPAFRLAWRRPDLQLLLILGGAALFAYAIVSAMGFRADSRLVPLLAAIPGLAFCLAALIGWLRQPAPDIEQADTVVARNALLQLAFLAVAVALIPLVGFLAAIGSYMAVMLVTTTSLRWLVLPYAAGVCALGWGLAKIINLRLPWF